MHGPLVSYAWYTVMLGSWFHQTHGIKRPAALKRHITTRMAWHVTFLVGRYEDPPCGVWSVQRLNPPPANCSPVETRDSTDLCVSQTCQLRGLYHPFGYDSTTWSEAVSVQVDEERGISFGCPVTPVPFMDWTCDYP